MSLPLQRWNLNSPYRQEDGDWVKSEDVAALEAEMESHKVDKSRLRKQRDEARALLKRANLALSLIGEAKCENLHHRKGHEHASGEPCPVEAEIDAALGEEVK